MTPTTTPLDAILAEHMAPTHVTKQEAHDELRDLLRVVTLIQRQVSEFRQHVHEIETSEHEHSTTGAYAEHVHQTCAALDRATGTLLDNARTVVRCWNDLDRYLTDLAKVKETAK